MARYTEEDDKDTDPSDMTRAALVRMVRKLKAKRLEERAEEDMEEDEAKAEEERVKLADMHAEKKGEAPKIAVEEDDLPEEIAEVVVSGGKEEKSAKKAKA
jgi:hypothetical protein